jgi:hypothetical protein
MSTLADRITAAATGRNNALTHAMFESVAKDIQAAQRFVMSTDVRDAVRDVITSRPSSLFAALRWCRPPFERMWLEWPTPDQPEPLADVLVKTTRVGAMIFTEPGSHMAAWRYYTVWSYNRLDGRERWSKALGLDLSWFEDPVGMGVSTMELGVDFSDLTPGAPRRFLNWEHRAGNTGKMTSEQLAKLRDDERNAVKYALTDDAERAAINEIESRIRARVRDTPTAENQLVFSSTLGPESIHANLSDVRDEIGVIMSLLILMNAKNCVSITKYEPPPKLNKARIKRGATPFLNHSTVHIKLSPSQQRVATARGMTPEEARRHLVKGHFKIRKTGVFWWSPHERGSATKGYVTHDYEVTP